MTKLTVGGLERVRNNWHCTTAAILGPAIAAVYLRVTPDRLTRPLSNLGRDDTFTLSLVKGIVEGRGLRFALVNERLGAPLGQKLYDYPMGTESFHQILLRMMSVLTHSAPLLVNIYFFVGFAMTGACSAWAFHKLGLRRSTSTVIAVLYVLSDYHFARGTSHVYLSNFFIVPLVCFAAVRLAEGAGPEKVGSIRFAIIAGLGFLTASCNSYYAVFTSLIWLTAVGIWIATDQRDRNLRGMIRHAVLALTPLVGMAIVNFPSLMYWRLHGGNEIASRREPWWTEANGLKLLRLFLPSRDSVLPPVEWLRARYATSPVIAEVEGGAYLGLAGILGFGILIAVLFKGSFSHSWQAPRRLAIAAWLSLCLLSYAVVGGLGSLVSYTISPQFRAVARTLIFLQFFALYAAGRYLQAVVTRFRHTSKRIVVVAAFSVLAAVAIIDLYPGGEIPPYNTIKTNWGADETYFHTIEAAMPGSAMVYTYPPVPYPEASGPNMPPYDQMRGFLHTDSLRWSYGAVRGRLEADWALGVNWNSVDAGVAELRARGFDGIVVDRRGSFENGDPLYSELRRILGVVGIENQDDTLFFFDLRNAASPRG